MVRQERDRRGPDSGGDPEGPRHLTDRAAALNARAEQWADDAQVRPGFRERVEALVRDRWHEPVIVLRLGDPDVGFEVPGRRQDGTVEGSEPVSQFFRGVLRGVGTAVVSVFSLANGGGAGRVFQRDVRVTGPANAQVLGLADRLRSLRGPWLAFSPSCLALVDTGSTYVEPADAPPPRIVWEARQPELPAVNFRRHTLTWPDGSVFRFPLHGRTEEQHLRKFVEPPGVVHWEGRPQ
ncbi:hypothetical protein [Amycolatopsis sp. FBCC-B4732]|uniref:hypothetical protein n=1 Tax=Amycolatopsis sp. FBCC-B4732 TaxID=3079339 RepID=UPI0028F3E7AA|nr:hypothetical protein [Amycolatopsis sp. FBCC-B4732]